jgi:hypothetical protein
MQQLPKGSFVLVSRKGNIGLGVFKMPEFHKKAREHMLEALGIKVFAPEEEVKEQQKIKNLDLTPQEHAFAVVKYTRLASFERVAKEMGRSRYAVRDAILRHNKNVEEQGFCLLCRLSKSPMEKTTVFINPQGKRRKDGSSNANAALAEAKD